MCVLIGFLRQIWTAAILVGPKACNMLCYVHVSYPCPTHYPGEEEGGAALWTLA